MRVLVLGTGRQGRAAVYDLVRHQTGVEVVAADLEVGAISQFVADHELGGSVECRRCDAGDPAAVDALFGEGFDLVIQGAYDRSFSSVTVAWIAAGS